MATEHDRDDEGIHLGKLAMVFIGFALLYLATSLYFSMPEKKQVTTGMADKVFGPIETTRRNAVLELTINISSLNESWAYVEVDLLDSARKKALMTFGSEQYQESGRDSEGPWTESKNNSDIRVTIPEPGSYYLRARVQGGPKNSTASSDITKKTKLRITIEHLRGSSALFIWAGVFLLIIGVVLNEIRNRTVLTFIAKMSDND